MGYLVSIIRAQYLGKLPYNMGDHRLSYELKKICGRAWPKLNGTYFIYRETRYCDVLGEEQGVFRRPQRRRKGGRGGAKSQSFNLSANC